MASQYHSKSKVLNPMLDIKKTIVKLSKRKFSVNPSNTVATTADAQKAFDDLSTMFMKVFNSLTEIGNAPLVSLQDSRNKFQSTLHLTQSVVAVLNQLQAIDRTLSNYNILKKMTPSQQTILADLFSKIQTEYNQDKVIVLPLVTTTQRNGTVISGKFPVLFEQIEEILNRLASIFFTNSAQIPAMNLTSFPFPVIPLENGVNDDGPDDDGFYDARLLAPTPPRTPQRTPTPALSPEQQLLNMRLTDISPMMRSRAATPQATTPLSPQDYQSVLQRYRSENPTVTYAQAQKAASKLFQSKKKKG